MSGTQFCPRCVGALEAIVATEVGELDESRHALAD
jgi:hypothetical protein